MQTAHEFDLEDRHGYLHARITGVNNCETVIGYTHDLQKGVRRARLSGIAYRGESLRTQHRSFFDLSGCHRQKPPSDRRASKWIAYVDASEAHERARMKFAEDVAVSRGANMRVFDAVQEARVWTEAELAAESMR